MEGFSVGAALVFCGVLAGGLFNIFSYVEKLLKRNVVAVFALDLIWSVMAAFGFILTIFTLADGQFALFELMCFCFGIAFELIFVQNLFAFFIKGVYNKITHKRRAPHDSGKIAKHS